MSTPDFALSLPGKWAKVPTTDAGLKQYSGPSETEFLSVSVLGLSQPVAQSDLSERLDEYLAARLKTERQQERSSPIQLSHPKIEAQGNGMVASYDGSQLDTSRRFIGFVVINAKRLVCFYYEALGAPEEQFRHRASQVVGSVQVAE